MLSHPRSQGLTRGGEGNGTRARVILDTGRHLGNFPQAFSHLALIEAAARIVLAERVEEFS